MGPRALSVALLGIAVLGGTARAQPSDEEDDTEPPDVVEGGIPADMERFELNDLTYTMRDDTFNTITVDRDCRHASGAHLQDERRRPDVEGIDGDSRAAAAVGGPGWLDVSGCDSR